MKALLYLLYFVPVLQDAQQIVQLAFFHLFAKAIYGDKINYHESVESCFKSGELVVVALQHDEFKLINDDWKSFDEQIILDCWRLLDRSKYNKIKYKCLGEKC